MSCFKNLSPNKLVNRTVVFLSTIIFTHSVYGSSEFYLSKDGTAENRQLLDGSTLTGDAFIFLTVTKPVKRIHFSIDGEYVNGGTINDDQDRIFSLLTINTYSPISPFPSALLANGNHTIAAGVTYTDDNFEIKSLVVDVFNSQRETALSRDSVININHGESIDLRSHINASEQDLTIVMRQPQWGILEREEMLYTANAEVDTLEKITIGILQRGGNFRFATLYIRIICNTGSERIVNLNWEPNPGINNHYLVFFKPTMDAEDKLVAVTKDETTAQLKALGDLQLFPGEQACFRLRAANERGISEFSRHECVTL